MSPFDPKPQPKPETPEAGSQPPNEQSVVKFAKDEPANSTVMPTLLGVGYGSYQARPENFLLSAVTHTAPIALLFWLLHMTVPTKIIPISGTPVELTSYVPMKVGKGGPSGGGGGDASKIKASTGVPPKSAKQQFTPPTVILQQKSKLMIEPTVVADLATPQTTQIGDPLSKLMTPSNGVGVGGGIGSGDGGVVVLDIVVGTDGRVHNQHVVRSLGMGLDEKALEGVKLWKFDPSKKDGRP